MNDLTKGAFLFGAGLVLGYLGAKAIDDPSGKVRGATVDAIAHGMNFKDKVMTSIERARENVEDMTAEAKHAEQQRHGKPMPADKTQK